MRTIVLLAGLALAGTPPEGRLDPPDLRPGLPEVPIAEVCDLEAEARALLAEAQRCDDACEVVTFDSLVGQSCVAAFQCTTALPVGGDRRAFVEEAERLDARKRATGECAIAGCMPPTDLEARCVEGRCELEVSGGATENPAPPR